MKPAPIKKGKIVRDWRNWPQSLAPSVAMRMDPSRGKSPGYQDKLLQCALRLAERVDGKKLTDVVVFYPRQLRDKITRNLQRHRKTHGSLAKFKGLTISSTTRLRYVCVAFFISDVEQHRTPADAYYVKVESQHRTINPEPLYDGSEPGTGGKPIHE